MEKRLNIRKYWGISYIAYLTGQVCTYQDTFKTKKEALVVAKQLKACGHTNISVNRIYVRLTDLIKLK